jgi:uncharacterized protein
MARSEWGSILGFVRLASSSRVFREPLTVSEAWSVAAEWLDCSVVWVPMPTADHRRVLGALLCAPSMSAAKVPDAHLAALAIEHELTLCSTDRDFAQLAGVRWHNPLA